VPVLIFDVTQKSFRGMDVVELG